MRSSLRFRLVALALFGALLTHDTQASAMQVIPESMRGAAAERIALRSRVEQLESQLRELTAELGLKETALIAISRMAAVGQKDLERFATEVERSLNEAAKLRAEVIALRAAYAALANPAVRDPAVRLLTRAEAAIADGRFEDADRELASLQRLRTEAADHSARLSAEAFIARAGLAMLRGDFDAARALYEQMDREEQRRGEANRWRSAMGLAGVDYTEGRLRSDRALLERAVRTYRERALPLAPRDRRAVDWAKTQNNLGNALWFLGDMELDAERLNEAAKAFEAAMGVWTETSAPLDWAKAQSNLGNVLVAMGRTRGGAGNFRKGVAAYRDALRVIARGGTPLERAAVEDSLGTALAWLGQSDKSPATLREAVDSFNAALQVRTERDHPFLWAGTQNNLAATLTALGEIEADTGNLSSAKATLETAIETLEAAMRVRSEAAAPFSWAISQMNLGNAHKALGQRLPGTAHLDLAVEAYRRAHRIYTPAERQVAWALIAQNLAGTLEAVARRTSRCPPAREAEEVARAALRIFSSNTSRRRNRASTSALVARTASLRERLCGG